MNSYEAVEEVVQEDAAGDSDWAITTRALTKRFDQRVAVNRLTMRIPRGTVAAFVGPNGSGKTTTIRMLLGLIAPTSGSATLLGHSIRRPASYVRRVGSLIEGPAFYPPLSARRNLEALAVLGGISRSRVSQVLEQVGLSRRAEDRFSSFSLGMKQRLGIAAALLPNPTLLVLDEPGNGLDPTGIAAMRALLKGLAEDGMTVLVSSHQLAELEQVASWVVMIQEGRLRFQGTMEELIRDTEVVSIATETPEAAEKLRVVLLGQRYAVDSPVPGRLTVRAREGVTAAAISKLAADAQIVLTELLTTHHTLEDAYFVMTESDNRA